MGLDAAGLCMAGHTLFKCSRGVANIVLERLTPLMAALIFVHHVTVTCVLVLVVLDEKV